MLKVARTYQEIFFNHDNRETFQDKLLRAMLTDLPTGRRISDYDNPSNDDAVRYLAALCVMLIRRLSFTYNTIFITHVVLMQ